MLISPFNGIISTVHTGHYVIPGKHKTVSGQTSEILSRTLLPSSNCTVGILGLFLFFLQLALHFKTVQLGCKRRPSCTVFCLRNDFHSLWHRFNSVLRTCSLHRDFGRTVWRQVGRLLCWTDIQWLWRPFEYSELTISCLRVSSCRCNIIQLKLGLVLVANLTLCWH